jgi:hypothetical protein
VQNWFARTLAFFSLFSCPISTQNPCQQHERLHAGLRAFAVAHHGTLLAVFRPCEGLGDPAYFMFPGAKRREVFPNGHRCYDEAQAALQRAVVAAFPRPVAGYISVKLVQGGGVFANVVIKSGGAVINYGGEPDYGISRELSQLLPNRMLPAQRPPLLCDGVYVDSIAAGMIHAIPISDEAGHHLGELQCFTVWTE